MLDGVKFDPFARGMELSPVQQFVKIMSIFSPNSLALSSNIGVSASADCSKFVLPETIDSTFISFELPISSKFSIRALRWNLDLQPQAHDAHTRSLFQSTKRLIKSAGIAYASP